MESNIDESDDVEHTFSFTITYQVIPCVSAPILNLGSLQFNQFYEIGSPILNIEFDGASNGSCDFTIYTSSLYSTALTFVQVTFDEPQDIWLPNDKLVLSPANLNVYETDNTKELYLSIWVSLLDSDSYISLTDAIYI